MYPGCCCGPGGTVWPCCLGLTLPPVLFITGVNFMGGASLALTLRTDIFGNPFYRAEGFHGDPDCPPCRWVITLAPCTSSPCPPGQNGTSWVLELYVEWYVNCVTRQVGAANASSLTMCQPCGRPIFLFSNDFRFVSAVACGFSINNPVVTE